MTAPASDRDAHVLLRPDLESLPPYRAGRPAAGPQGVVAYKLSSNESPYDPLPRVRDALAAATADLNRYPDPGARELSAALASRWKVPSDHIVTGTGSVGVCQQIISACAGPGDEVIYAWRSFEAYPLITTIAGARSVQIPLRSDESHDLEAMATSITPRTRAILICTPNNPTGAVVKHRDLVGFLARVPSDIVIVVDEAYVEFVGSAGAADGLALYREHANVVVLRTFSKAHGLAALRVGFAVARAPIADLLRRVGMPFAVSSLAQVAALESLRAEGELAGRVEETVDERERMLVELVRQGHPMTPSHGNFVWLRLGATSMDFAELCASHGLAVRAFAGEGVRITVGVPAANDRLLSLTADFAHR